MDLIDIIWRYLIVPLLVIVGLFLSASAIWGIWVGVSDLPPPPNTVAELSPGSLWVLIITGTAVGVYAPMVFWRHCKEHWDQWPIQTRIWMWAIGIGFVGAIWGSTLYLIKP